MFQFFVLAALGGYLTKSAQEFDGFPPQLRLLDQVGPAGFGRKLLLQPSIRDLLLVL